VLSVLALSLGAIVRNTAGGIALFPGLLFVVPGPGSDPTHEHPERNQPIPAVGRRHDDPVGHS